MLSLTFHTHTHSRGAGTRGKECSTGQRRPILQDKAKKEKKLLQHYTVPEKKGRETQKSQTTKGKS